MRSISQFPRCATGSAKKTGRSKRSRLDELTRTPTEHPNGRSVSEHTYIYINFHMYLHGIAQFALSIQALMSRGGPRRHRAYIRSTAITVTRSDRATTEERERIARGGRSASVRRSKRRHCRTRQSGSDRSAKSAHNLYIEKERLQSDESGYRWHPQRQKQREQQQRRHQPSGMGMRSSSGAFNYSLRTIPPLVSFGDYISEYLFAASRSRRPTPLFLFHRSLAIYPLLLIPFSPLRAAPLHSLPTAAATAVSSSSSIVGYLVATDAGCLLVLESLILPCGPRNTPASLPSI